MEFIGQIKKILPARSGVSERTGNEWKSQPFVFEYYENPSDRWADSVLLETFDTNIMEQLDEYVKVRIGFGHKIREYDGKVYNELRIYKFERIDGQKQPAQGANDAQANNNQQPQNNAATGGKNNGEKKDDLPF